jgi:hypothetical protein
VSKASPLLTEFLLWAGQQQRLRVSPDNQCVTTVKVGIATGNRAAGLEIELFKVEPDGLITDELEKGGTLWVWENGCADALVVDFRISADEPQYLEHWDCLQPEQLEAAFRPFANHFEVV